MCFVSSYPPNRARLSEYAQNLVTALASRKSIETIYLLADEALYQDQVSLTSSKVKLYRVWKADSVFSLIRLLRCILKIKPDIVHFNVSFQSFGKSKLTNLGGLSLILICRLFGLRVIAGVHTLAKVEELEKYSVKPTLINKIGILVSTKIVLSAQKVIVLVKTYCDSLKQRYNHKGVLYIPHGTTISERPKIISSQKTILLFGHMGPHKGLPVMLSVFQQMVKERNDVSLIVAGANHPNFPNYLHQFTSTQIPNVEFTDYVPQNELDTVFGRSHVVVLPYHAAPGTSGVFHLACGYSLPVVASDLPEIREIVSDGASAILVPPGDVDALKKAILLVLDDEQVSSRMSEQNLAFAKKESWDAIAEAYENAYFGLINVR